MALRIVDEGNFPTLGGMKFKDQYPGDYSGDVAGLPAARDYITEQIFSNSPMMDRERAQALAMQLRTQSAARSQNSQRYEDQVPFKAQFWGRTQSAEAQHGDYLARAQQYNAQQDDQARKNFQVDLNIMTEMRKAPPGQRDPIIKLYQRHNQKQGIELDPELLKFYKKADEDDWAAAQWAGQEFLKNHPDVDQAGANKVINSNPAALSEVLALIAQAKENKLKNEQTELENKVWQQTEEALSQAPTRPQEPLQQAPVQVPSLQLQQAPGGSQIPQRSVSMPMAGGWSKERTIAQIRAEAQRQRVDPDLAVAVATQESYLNPQAMGDGGKSIGFFQLQPAAAQDVGMTPQQRMDPALNVRGGVAYLKQKLDQSGGNVDQALLRYNGGGDPNYVQNVKKHMTGLPKPHSESVAQAPRQVRESVKFYDQKITEIQEQLDRMPPGAAMLPGPKAIIEQYQKRQEFYMKQREAIEKRYEDKPSSGVLEAAIELFPETPWVNLKPAQKRAAITYRREVEEAGRLDASAAHGRDAVLRKPLTTEENRQYGTEPGTTQGELSEQRGQVKQRVELPTAQQTKIDGYSTVYRMSGRLTEQLADPEMRKALQPVIGTILSDPQAWYNRFVGKKIEGLTDTQTRFASALALQMIQLRKELIGTAQTAQELTAAEGFLTSLADVTPETILAKIEGIRDYVYLAHDSLLDNAEDLGQRVPKRLPKPKGFEREAAPTAQTPDTKTVAPAPPVSVLSPAAQRARDIVRGGR